MESAKLLNAALVVTMTAVPLATSPRSVGIVATVVLTATAATAALIVVNAVSTATAMKTAKAVRSTVKNAVVVAALTVTVVRAALATSRLTADRAAL